MELIKHKNSLIGHGFNLGCTGFYENEIKFTMQLQNEREQSTRNETAHTADIKSQ